MFLPANVGIQKRVGVTQYYFQIYMKQNKIIYIFIFIIIILLSFILWQSSKKVKDNLSIINTPVVNNAGVNVKTPVVAAPISKIKDNLPIKDLPPAKDETAMRTNFKYEVSLDKILDKKWMLVDVINYDDSLYTPKKTDAFSITFKKDGTLSGTTDCNSYFGKYTLKNKVFKITSLGQTLMYCDGSEETKFITYLGQVNNFMFNGEDDLVLGFEFDSGSMIFK